MSLDRYINSLRKPEQFAVAIKLVRLAMPLWEEYVMQESSKEDDYIYYYGNALGEKYLVEIKLLQRIVNEVEKYVNTDFNPTHYEAHKFESLNEELWIGLRGLQWEEEWSVPKEVKLLVFSISNLLEATMGKDQTRYKESYIYVSVNQSVDSLVTSKRMTLREAHHTIGLP